VIVGVPLEVHVVNKMDGSKGTRSGDTHKDGVQRVWTAP
jgi:hypothetical protein